MASGNPPRGGPARLCIAVGGAAVAQAVAAAHAFAASAALPAETAARLAIVVEELVANLVDHADLPACAELELTLARAGARIAITLVDPATPFDPRSDAPSPAIPERGGSAGLALVRAFARIDGYDRDGDRNLLRLSMPAAGL
ncbi:MAG: ATP-binding protein [Sandarakinorhabdus sp.]|nr:ATP-binding protein [Sandarakinorhabdus sp.]